LQTRSLLEKAGYFMFCIYVTNDYYDNGVVVRFKTVEVTAVCEWIQKHVQTLC